jgi:hypothetical protein
MHRGSLPSRDAEESRIVGLVLLRLGNRAGMTLRQVAVLASDRGLGMIARVPPME